MEKNRNNGELVKKIDEVRGIYKEWDQYFLRKYDRKVTWWNVETWEQWEVQYFPTIEVAEKFVKSYKEIDEQNNREVEEHAREQDELRNI